MANQYFHANYFHANYWHTNYWYNGVIGGVKEDFIIYSNRRQRAIDDEEIMVIIAAFIKAEGGYL